MVQCLKSQDGGTVQVKVGDLVEHDRISIREHGLGLVVELAEATYLTKHKKIAQVMWAKFPEDAPQWYDVHRLRVVAPCNPPPNRDRM